MYVKHTEKAFGTSKKLIYFHAFVYSYYLYQKNPGLVQDVDI